MYESETQRLQRDADNFTKQLESQKRDETKFVDALGKEAKTLKELKDQIREKRPSTKEGKKKAATIKRLENQLDKEIVQYNQTVAENKKLRNEIDKYRKDKKAADEIYSKLMKQKGGIESDTMKTTKNRNKELTEIEDATMSTILIKKTYHEKKEDYNGNIKTLKERLKDKVDDQSAEERSRPKEIEKMDKDQTNPMDIIQARLANWKARLRHKKDTLDMYVKHINIIRDAFDQIKKATGISNIQEIVVTFIKSQEQTDALNSHLNTLDQEIDGLEEQKAELRKELKIKQVPSFPPDLHRPRLTSTSP
jgi:chromosome segregation ATPase